MPTISMSAFGRLCLPAAAALTLSAAISHAAESILLPLQRTAYQTNEWIDVSVVREDFGPLTLRLASNDGSRLSFSFPAAEVQPEQSFRHTDHYHVNGWLLRPGHYRVEAESGGRAATAELDLFSHVRRSDFRLISWGRANGKHQLVEGEDSLGFNLFYGSYGQDTEANFIRAGMDFIGNCVMGGGHQMDLRIECDWSDPYVTRGGTMRVVRRAFQDRTRPNVPGVHFYDEPGLTWWKHDATGEFTPHNIPAQVRSHQSAFDRQPLSYHQVDPNNPEHVRRWNDWARWKLGFMDAAWKEAQFGVSFVRPDYLSLTQSQYGWTAFTDGYYFNVVRSLPISSGHGGYDDVGCGYFYPSFTLEWARARDRWKPCWYLPAWYGSTQADVFRLEQYLSFQTNIQGLMTPPDIDPFEPGTKAAAQGVVESNHLMARLGPLFQVLPPAKPAVGVLYSLSYLIHHQIQDMSLGYAHSTPHWQGLLFTYLAGKLTQQPLQPLLEEDILDGTLADDHRALVLAGLDYLDPQVLEAIQRFAARGGLVLTTGGTNLAIPGAVNLGVTATMPDQAIIDRIMAEKAYEKLGPYTTVGKHLEAARPLASALKGQLDKAGIRPVLETDISGLSATRQGAGDVEYLFAVNATYDEADGGRNAVKAAAGTVSLPDDGRPVYDAVLGGPAAAYRGRGGRLTGSFRFGPGQMRVWARTARPIGRVQVFPPAVHRGLVLEEQPCRVDVAAVVLDTAGQVLDAAVPLEVRVTDPLGVTCYELYRSTRGGSFSASLPLAANDPGGEWTLSVRDLLSDQAGAARFTYRPLAESSAIAGATPRAVLFGNDGQNIFRFARLHHEVTVVSGTSPFLEAAAQRLAAVLQPWGVRCKTLALADAAKPWTLSAEEARTWVGLNYTGSGQIKPGDGNAPALAGFAVQGPVILLGNSDDHPMIKFLADQKFLPYMPDRNSFPGAGRGLIAWQRDGVGRGQESVTLIAYDAEGISEAVGSFYEAVAGIEPLTRWDRPRSSEIQAATTAPGRSPAAAVSWTLTLPDRVVAMKAEKDALNVLTLDGSLSVIRASKGNLVSTRPLSTADRENARKEMTAAAGTASVKAVDVHARPDRIIKLMAVLGDRVAVAYWGGTLRIADDQGKVLREQRLPQDVTALTWAGGRVVAGLASGEILALQP
ncbi:MAG: hypothetical protein HYU36_00975 [Planctomycetes bacterium]|nr:hypothetical protein [Planctomycetota bacterium]